MSNATYADYRDRTFAGWAGKTLGGIVGAPLESHKCLSDLTIETCWPKTVYPNDDLDIQVVWLEMMEEIGLDLRSIDLARYWQERCWYNFSEYGVFLNNLQKGIHPPRSGTWNNGFYFESMGCPIRAEIWGMICPGDPERAAVFARRDGGLDHGGVSIEAEVYWASCIALAYVRHDLMDVLKEGFSHVSRDCVLQGIFDFVLAMWLSAEKLKDTPERLSHFWRTLIRQYGHRDASKLEINFAFTVLALLEGGEDMKRTLVTAINLGWDADCTAATAGALIGVLHGGSSVPADWLEKIGSTLSCDVEVRHRNATLDEFTQDTCRLGLEHAIRLGKSLPSDTPSAEYRYIMDRIAKRSNPFPLDYETEYFGEPVLSTRTMAEATLLVRNRTDQVLSIAWDMEPDSWLDTDIERQGRFTMTGHDSIRIPVRVRQKAGNTHLHDRNRVRFHFVVSSDFGQATEDTEVGFSGARLWNLYGPYWDLHDRTQSQDCPYRSGDRFCHPALAGCWYIQEHEYVDLYREYLDEPALIASDLLEAMPVPCETGEDSFHLKKFIGFHGEACWYLTRTFSVDSETQAYLTLGTDCPFRAWWDGNEVLTVLESKGYAPRDHSAIVTIRNGSRLVLKLAVGDDDARIGLSFLLLDSVGDKKRGISYLSDTIGSSILFEDSTGIV